MEYKIELIDGKYHIHILDANGCTMGKSFHMCNTEKEALHIIEIVRKNDDIYNMNQITNYKG